MKYTKFTETASPCNLLNTHIWVCLFFTILIEKIKSWPIFHPPPSWASILFRSQNTELNLNSVELGGTGKKDHGQKYVLLSLLSNIFVSQVSQTHSQTHPFQHLRDLRIALTGEDENRGTALSEKVWWYYKKHLFHIPWIWHGGDRSNKHSPTLSL